METLLVVNVLPHLYAVCCLNLRNAATSGCRITFGMRFFYLFIFLPPVFQRYILINLSLSLRTHGFATIKTIICQLVIEKLNISYSRSIS